MVLDIWNKVLSLTHKKDDEWKSVVFPRKKNTFLFQVIGLIVILVGVSILFSKLNDFVTSFNVFGGIITLLASWFLVFIWLVSIFKISKSYLALFKRDHSRIADNLVYMVEALKLYDEEYYETKSEGKAVKEKRIVRVIRIYYKETEKYVKIRLMRDGDRFTTMNISDNISSALGLEIEKSEENPKFTEYTFLKFKEEINQYIFSSKTFDRSFFENITTSIIPLTNTQSFDLKKNTNMGLYGRTGTGKTIALQWFLYNAVAKGCGTDSDTLLSIVDGKGADLFSLGEMLKQELEGNVSVGQSPQSLAKLSREFVEAMNARFEVIKENSSLNADAYDLGLTPNFLFVDELASIRDSCGSTKAGKDLWNEILQNLGLVARKGRQASCHLCISTQDPNAENIPVELRNQISSVLYLGNPANDRLKMAFSMCELENVPTVSGRKGEAVFYADGNNMIEPEITIVPFVDVKTKQDFINVIRKIKPISIL